MSKIEQERMSADELQDGLRDGSIKMSDGRGSLRKAAPASSFMFDDEDATDSVTIELKGRLPSVNSCYSDIVRIRGGATPKRIDGKMYYKMTDLYVVRVANKQAKAFKKRVAEAMKGKKIQRSAWYEMVVTFHGQLFNKGDGEPHPWDHQNRLKLLEDSMVEALGFDDCRVIQHYLRKEDGPWGCTATIKVWRAEL